MASRTVSSSVTPVDAPPPNQGALDLALDLLRSRFPGAVFGRYLGAVPRVGVDCFVAPGAAVIGDVTLHDGSSVWYGCVLRGDVNAITVGPRSNVQDGTVIHLGDRDPTVIGADVVVGHRAVVHGCTIEDACLIGIQATVLDGAHIGHGSVIGAGAVVPAGMVVPPHSLVLGVPGRVTKTLEPEAEVFHRELAAKYGRLQGNYRRG